jgi:hypothetical protein
VDDISAGELQFVCTDPALDRYDLIFHLPDGITPGTHKLQMQVGTRRLAPIPIEVAT